MKNVLIPYDGSEPAKHALRFVLDLPEASRPAAIHLLNVQDWPRAADEFVTADMIEFLREGALKEGRDLLEPASALAAAAKIPCSAHALMGDVASTIVQQAEQLECDHIVMGTRGMGVLKGLLVGSVATKVLHLAKTPVTFLR